MPQIEISNLILDGVYNMLIQTLRNYFESVVLKQNQKLTPRFTRTEVTFLGSIGDTQEHSVMIVDTRIDEVILKVVCESFGDKLVRYSQFTEKNYDVFNEESSVSFFLDNSSDTVIINPKLLDNINKADIATSEAKAINWLESSVPSDNDLIKQEAWLLRQASFSVDETGF